jgi:CheY-like chemotaxis protein
MDVSALRPPAPMRVLVVDDNPTVRHSLTRVLQAHGLEATAAENGAEALLAVGANSFDAIVCDLMMPVMDGMTFFDDLVALRPAQARRVIFVSAWVDAEPVKEFLDRAGQPVLAKPFEVPLLVDAIQALGWGGGRDGIDGSEGRG